jgi:hypothetical protein
LVVPTTALAAAGLVLLALRAQGAERRLGVTALVIGVAVILGALVLRGLGADYLLDRNLLPALIPLTMALAAGFGARRAGRLGLAGAGALCVLFTLSAVLTATRKDLQRPDWRDVAAALGHPRVPRVVVAPASGDQPLRFYLRDARDAESGAVVTKEVIVITASGSKPLSPSLPRPFIRTQRQPIAGFDVTTLRATRMVRLVPLALSTGAGTAAQPLAILIQSSPPLAPMR